jgi:hypothetical protein
MRKATVCFGETQLECAIAVADSTELSSRAAVPWTSWFNLIAAFTPRCILAVEIEDYWYVPGSEDYWHFLKDMATLAAAFVIRSTRSSALVAGKQDAEGDHMYSIVQTLCSIDR